MLCSCNAFTDLEQIVLADTGGVDGPCDPVNQLGCKDELACVLRATDGLTPVCSDAGTTAVGAPCSDALECEAGSQCIAWPPEYSVGRVCSQVCEVQTGQGCAAAEQCVNPIGEFLDVYGFCIE